MAINNTLKDIREERNLVQADLAKAAAPDPYRADKVWGAVPEQASPEEKSVFHHNPSGENPFPI